MHICLLTGTPGLGKASIKDKIVRYLEGKTIEVGHAEVEAELLSLVRQREGKSTPKNLVELIGERPQDYIRKYWGKAYIAAVEKATTGNPDVAIVLTRLVYYRFQTYEFYTPVDTKVIGMIAQKHRIQSVLTLIDDVYDAYYRLSQSGQVFDIKAKITRLHRTGRTIDDLRGLYKDALNTTIDSLLRVLAWREKEIEAGVTLAGALRAEYNVLAVKHPVSIGAKLLLGKKTKDLGLGKSYPVYVSHPISRPRKENLKKGEWPPFVSELDDIVENLASRPINDCHILPIMPTAIDEFRLLGDGTHFVPHLKDRWPLPKGNLLYSRPEQFGPDQDFETRGIARIFDPPLDDTGRRVGMPLTDDEISGMLRTLELAVQLQMANRDHLLVRQCPGFFLYRPTYLKHNYSGGVSSEIINFEQILKYASSDDKKRRRIAFVHKADDAKKFFAEKTSHIHVIGACGEIKKVVEKLHSGAGKPGGVLQPDKDVITEAMQTLAAPSDDLLTRILSRMYSGSPDSPIGTTKSMDLSHAKQAMLFTIAQQRTGLLTTCLLNDPWKYTFHNSSSYCLYEVCSDNDEDKKDDQVNIYVDIVENVDTNPDVREATIKRLKEFFVSTTKDESEQTAQCD